MTDPAWRPLQQLTVARIGLTRSGASIATAPLLAFRLAHAQARDAVQHDLADLPGLSTLGHPVLTIRSRATDRRTYLLRPDLGRQLDDHTPLTPHPGPHDLAIVIADGLSALAAERHAVPLLTALLPALNGWTLAPLVIAHRARVKLGDAVANALGATAVLILIGERPGLSAPDSLGAYLTYAPTPATTDADRNCVSNIRPEGLPYAEAARTIAFLLRQMRALRHSGIALKDDSQSLTLTASPPPNAPAPPIRNAPAPPPDPHAPAPKPG